MLDIRDQWNDVMTTSDVIPINNYIPHQVENMERSRKILLDWLLEVAAEYSISSRAYIRSQVIIDRYFSINKNIDKNIYQLIGVTAIWIGSKIEDPYVCSIHDLSYITDHTYTTEQIAEMEINLLRSLDMDLFFPISTTLLYEYVKQMDMTDNQIEEAKFLLVYTTFNIDLMKYHPSILCLCVCVLVIGHEALVGNDKDDDIVKCMREMVEWLSKGLDENLGNLNAVKEWNLTLNTVRYK